MKIKLLFVSIILISCIEQIYGQWDAQISQYWRVRTYFNPSFAGETENIQLSGLYRQQWVGITNAPKTFIGTADMQLKFLGKYHGVGAAIMNESIGLYKNNSYGIQYAYKHKWKKWKNNSLNIGMQLNRMSLGFDASRIRVADEGKDDPAIPTGDAKSIFDVHLGVSFVTPNYYVGLSATHLLKPNYDLGGSPGSNSSSGSASGSANQNDVIESYLPRTFYFTGGYNIKFENPLYELQPSFLVKTDNVFTQYDVTLRLVYNKMFNGGLSWRKGDGFVFLLGFKYKEFDAGYAYDLSTSAISTVSSGSHELFFRYSMPFKLDKDEKKRHKSIRIL